MATNQPVSSDVPEEYDPSRIESSRAADTRYVQPGRDWLTRNVQPVLHQLSQMPPESPDIVKARLLARATRAMDPTLVNADIRTPEQTTAILHRIYGGPPAPASTVTAPPGTATPGTATSGTATPVNRALAVAGQAVTAAPVDPAVTVADQASPVDHALTVADQALPPISHIPGGFLPLFARPHNGAQYEPLSTSSRSWTDPNMPPPSNYMPWGDDAPAAAAPAARPPARATAPAAAPTAHAAAAPTAPPQSSPGFFSGLFKDPYAGMSPKQMNVKAQEMQSAGDENLANLLTQRADNAMTSSDGSFAQGGSVDENHPVVQRAMHLVRSFLLNG